MPTNLTQIVWTAPVTNKLLFDAGASFYRSFDNRNPEPNAVGPSVVDENGFRFRSGAFANNTSAYNHVVSTNYTFRGAVLYVTGSHAFKAGGFFYRLNDDWSGIKGLAGTGQPSSLISW